MHIEPAKGFDALGLPAGAKNLPKPDQPPSASPETGDWPGSTALSALRPYIQRAAQVDEIRNEAIEDAKRLLAAGELDTPEAAAGAAENILTLGI